YSTDEVLSREMWQFLDFIFQEKGAQTGEAYREFVVALALARLRLRIEHMEMLVEKHGGDRGDAVDRLLWKKITDILADRKRRESEPRDQPLGDASAPFETLGEADRAAVRRAVSPLAGQARQRCIEAGARP